ncbi:MAG: HDOD domain-containing protein, partial [Gammaproteobacteria bacterium]
MNLFKQWFKSSANKGDKKATSDKLAKSGNSTNDAVARPSAKVDIHQLKQFAPLRDFDDISLQILPQSAFAFDYAKDEVVFELDQPVDATYYLLKGRLLMQPNSNSSYEVVAGSALAVLPLNSSRQFGSTATAMEDVTILKIFKDLNRIWTQQQQHQEDVTYTELLDLQLPDQLGNMHFFENFCRAYRENQLRLPSLPQVAIKLQQAMQQDIGIDEAVEIIHVDAPIVTRLIQVANSPLYASTKPVKNCHDAVYRIGLLGTRSVVMSICMKQLFQTKDRTLMKSMQQLWKNSLYISSLCYVLAEECGGNKIQPEDALLAGLVCDIGGIPLIHFAEGCTDRCPSLSELESCF